MKDKFSEGIFAVYKPKGPTSHDVVDYIRKSSGIKKVGHAGTLDPLASGVLVIGVGRESTKKLNEAVCAEKEYFASICLGMESATDDAEGPISAADTEKIPTAEEIRCMLNDFLGEILQTPPAYSAVKIRGKSAYKFARKGKVVALLQRKVFVKEIEFLEYKWPHLKIRVVTGPGVYIRAIARDMGRKLGTGGYIQDLERTRIGNFTARDAISLYWPY